MATPDETRIAEAEERLRLAMIRSDLPVLDALLSPTMVFTNHLGQVFGKAEDLAAHRSGALRIAALAPSEMRIALHGPTAIVSVRMQIVGLYGAQPFAGDYRYTRVWAAAAEDDWQVVAGHVSQLPARA